MQILEVPLFNNIIHDISGRKVNDTVLQDGMNVMFDNGNVIDRYGLQTFLDSVADPVKKVTTYKRMFSDTQQLIVFTTRDIYYYDETTLRFRYLTRNFSKGTVASNASTVTATFPSAITEAWVSGGTNADLTSVGRTIVIHETIGIYAGMLVTGTGIPTDTYVDRVGSGNKIIISKTPTAPLTAGNLVFSWEFDHVNNTGSNYLIAFGASGVATLPDIDDPDLTWYPCTYTDGTHLAITGGPTMSAGTGYIVRLRYSGDESEMWNVAYPYSAFLDENILIATNGVDRVQEYTGTGYFERLPEYTNKCIHLGYWGSIGNGQIICSAPYDTTTGSYNDNAIEVSDPIPMTVDAEVGAVEAYTQWNYGATYPLYDEMSGIKGVLPLGENNLVVYKNNSISQIIENPNYSVDDPFYVKEGVKRNLGVPNIDVVATFESFHIFFSGDNIYMFDGFNETKLGDGNISYIINNINKTFIDRCFSIVIRDKNLYCLFFPFGSSENCNRVMLYNYREKNFTFWNFTNISGEEIQFTTAGNFIKQYAPTWGSFLFKPDAHRVNGDATLTMEAGSTTAGIEAGMHITGSGVPAGTTIASVTSTSALEMSANASMNSTIDDLKIGWYPSELPDYRWLDLKTLDSYYRIAVGDLYGNVYELSDLFYKDDTTDILSTLTTKDFELNKGLTFLFSEVTVRAGLRETSDGYLTGEVFRVRASMDYGRTWSGWVNLALNPLTEEEGFFMEKKASFHIRGKALRLQFEFTDPFTYEAIFIKFNPMGNEFKYNR